MPKNISTGIEQLVGKRSTPAQKQLEQHERSWRDLRNKLDSLLIGTNVIKGDEIRKQCQELDSLDQAGRYNHINSIWGKLYADRSLPLLNQLESLEKEITRLRSVPDPNQLKQ